MEGLREDILGNLFVCAAVNQLVRHLDRFLALYPDLNLVVVDSDLRLRVTERAKSEFRKLGLLAQIAWWKVRWIGHCIHRR